MLRRSLLLISGLFVLLFFLSVTASADPDPPPVDGGNVTFIGDWVVDPGDHLTYVNQTIVLNGNLTISPTGTLELVNCTVYLNGTIPPGDWPMSGIRVGVDGTLNITEGSYVRPLHLAYFRADPGAHLLIEDSTVAYIGHTAPLEGSGLYSEADDTVIRRSTIISGNRGMILNGVNGSVVEDTVFTGISRVGLYIIGETSNVTLRNLSFESQMESIGVLDCSDIVLTNVSIDGPSYGIGLTNGTVRLRNVGFIDVGSDAIKYWTYGSVQWEVDGESWVVNSSIRINGSLEVLAGGTFGVINSTISMDNPTTDGVNGIHVRSGGEMSVTKGSTVSSVAGGYSYEWNVDTGGLLMLDGASVTNAGWSPTSPGLSIASSGNTLINTTFSDCFVGLSVTGSGNDGSQLTFINCSVGAKWMANDSALTDLVFEGCTSTGLHLEAASNLTVTNCQFDVPNANRALHAYDCTDLTITGVIVRSSQRYAIDLMGCSDVMVMDSDLGASGEVVNIDGMNSGTNVTIQRITMINASQGMFLTSASHVTLRNVTLEASSSGIYARSIRGLTMEDCVLDGGAAILLEVVDSSDVSIVQSRFNGTGRLVWIVSTTGLVMDECLLSNGDDVLYLDGTSHVVLTNITALDVDRGFLFDSAVNVSAFRCIVDTASYIAVDLHSCQAVEFSNLTVLTAPVAVSVRGGNATVVSGLITANVTSGLLITGPSVDNVLEDTILDGVPVAVRVTYEVDLRVVDCSFTDCPIALDGDMSSNITYQVTAFSQIVNSNCSMRGWYTVSTTGVLNVTASHITFTGMDALDCRIVAALGSTLRLLDGTVLDGTDVPFSVVAEGNLRVRNANITGGGELGGKAALAASGAVVAVTNTTFSDCGLALSLGGADPMVRDCVFEGNRQSVLLVSVQRPRFIGCTFSASNTSWDIQGNFSTNLQITSCHFEGGDIVPMAMFLQSPSGPKASLVITDVTISNYTVWGLQDDHFGSIIMTDCVVTNADLNLGTLSTDSVSLSDLTIVESKVEVGPAGFIVSDCTFHRASFHAHDNTGGSLLSRCTFTGSYGPDLASVHMDGSIQITVRDLDLTDVAVGIWVSGGSEITASGIILNGAASTALEVNGSIVRLEACRLRGLEGTGIRVWNAGSRVEFRNGTIQANAGRTGHDVDASNGGDAWLLNTTFDRTSVQSTGAGRVEVLWHVTVEPSLPWGGVLWDPDFLTVVDASGEEVVNRSRADSIMRLYEFSEVDGTRTLRTPHTFNVSDAREGVSYSGEHIIDASDHLLIDLLDVANPAARGGPDQVVAEDLKVTLNASSSSDNDPTFQMTGSFRWSFDEHGNNVVLEGMVVSYVFSVPGKYRVNLTVWDLAGNIGTDNVIIQVRDVTPPVIRFGGNVTVEEDDWYIFDASGTTDNDPVFDFTTGTFLWKIDLGTGVLERDTATFGHAFPEPGNFSGTLSVWDKAGKMAREEFWVHVMDITPPVISSVDNATVFEPMDGLLDARACFDNVGIVSYQWTVTYKNRTGGQDDLTMLEGAAPSYPFDRLGTYIVTLVLSDAVGNANSTEITVVYDDVPYISLPGWAISMAGQRMEVSVNVSTIYSTNLLVTIVEGPDAATIEGPPTSAFLVWTPGPEQEDIEVTITVQVHDGFVASHASITIHVNPARGPTNRAPIISSQPPLSAKRDTPYIYPVDAEDPDGDVLDHILLAGPVGMAISQGGTVSWDPPFDRGTVLVEVHLLVTDGRDTVEQRWTIRWREPPNASPLITFELALQEVRLREEFLVDLSVYVKDPEAFDVDADDANHVLVWEVGYDPSMVTLLSRDGMVFRFQAMDVKGVSTMNFTAYDPSRAHDTTVMDLVVKGRSTPAGEDTGWMLWIMLSVLVAVAIAGGAVASRRRRGNVSVLTSDEPEEPDLGPPPEVTPREAETLKAALDQEGPLDASSFVEVGRTGDGAGAATVVGAAVEAPKVSRVISGTTAPERTDFRVEGVAILEANGSVLASTGKVDDIIGPYGDSVEEVRKGLRGDGLAVLELEGHRVLVALRSGLGSICVVKGREDDGFRSGLRDHLGALLQDRSTEGALGVLEDILTSAGSGQTAEVVRDAWTAHLDSDLTYQGSVVLLEVRLRNDTDHILNNVRLRLFHDEDALSVQSMTPKLLTSHGRMSLGNVPPRKDHRLAISLVPELCTSSTIRMLGTYTDMEGRTVHVPTPTMPVDVECPYIEGGGEMDEERLLSLSETGLGFTGRRVFNYGLDVDHQDIYRIAVDLVGERGPMKVMDLNDESLMRAEAWFLGTGEGGAPQVLVRVSSHGTDYLLELFVTSDDGAVATGLLTHLAGEVMDRAASKMPGKRVERVRDAATLEDIAIWPSLLDYKIMGD